MKLKQHPARTKPRKPASRIEKACRAVNWFSNFTLQQTSIFKVEATMPISEDTVYYANMRNILTRQLKASVQKDYQKFRQELIDSGEFTPCTQEGEG